MAGGRGVHAFRSVARVAHVVCSTGVAAAAALGRVPTSLTFGVTVHDPITFSVLSRS
jgi:hypothetical protein